MKKYHMIASTVGGLADHRVLGYSKPDKIGTIIVDEAGQLTQLNALQLFKFKSRRYVFIGDNNQLRAQVASYSAEASGLSLSIMDWQSMWWVFSSSKITALMINIMNFNYL